MRILALMVGPYGRGICVRFRLSTGDPREVLARGVVERVGEAAARISYHRRGEPALQRPASVPDCGSGVRLALELLTDPDVGVVGEPGEISGVGHRVAHGGERFRSTRAIDEQVLAGIRACSSLAPLHNPYNLLGIESASRALPFATQVAVFATAFHQTMPDHAFLYGLPYEYYIRYGIRRYGFHGASHRYAAERAAHGLGRPLESLRLVTCHLGSGCSVTAVKGGCSVDTSMGFTPLEGLLMSTRCGDLDASVVGFLMEHEGLGYRELEDLLNRRSGLLGVSGISGEIPELMAAARDGSYRADLALRMFCYRLRKAIAAYLGVLGGADAVVFTGSVGEGEPEIRERALEGLECLGIHLDPERNAGARGEAAVHREGSPVQVLVIPGDEEAVIAAETAEFLRQRSAEELM